MQDLSIKEKRILNGGMTSSVFATTLYESDPVDHEHAFELWFSRMRVDKSNVEGRFYAHRNSRLAIEGVADDSTTPSKVERRVAYQYLARPFKATDPEMLREQLIRDLDLSGESNVKVLTQKAWPYFSRYTLQGLKQEKLWKILEMQGENNTLWIGSSVCFESVLDVVSYNDQLLQRISIKKS